MIRRPPSSPLFPYPTLFRSLVAGIDGATRDHDNTAAVTAANLTSVSGKGKFSDTVINALKSGTSPGYRLTCGTVTGFFRSEEHTSELQSQSNIVCRLLLEKK